MCVCVCVYDNTLYGRKPCDSLGALRFKIGFSIYLEVPLSYLTSYSSLIH